MKIIRDGVMIDGMGRKDLGDSVSRGGRGAEAAGWRGAPGAGDGEEPGRWGGSAGVLGMLW